jgi:hypothetical protein
MQGSMRTQRRTIGIVAWTLGASLVLAVAAPLAAHAGPLLSGYGGPGQGNQAILGSTLIGGPGGGSGGAGGGGPESGAAATGSAQATIGTSGAPTGASATRTHAGGSAGRGGRGAGVSGRTATRAERPTVGGELSDRSYRGFENAGSSSALGLSGADIVYIVLAAAALAFAGLLTRRLAGTKAAKGHS